MNRSVFAYCQNELNVTLYRTVQRFAFTGKERDGETGFGYFGARYMDHELTTMWLSVDPMADKYPSLSPYAYCAWSPVQLMDPDGEDVSPIYDIEGNFLGTDDLGIKGTAIVMDRNYFVQGMNHNDAESCDLGLGGFQDELAYNKYSEHYSKLKDRPDYDGFVTISEGVNWAIEHPNAKDFPTADNTLYIDAAQLDLGYLTVKNSGLKAGENFKNINLYNYVNKKSISSINTTYALGNTSIKLIDNDGTIIFKGDTYDWDYHKGSLGRNILIGLERLRTGINDNHGFNVNIYGTKKINQSWPF